MGTFINQEAYFKTVRRLRTGSPLRNISVHPGEQNINYRRLSL